MTAETIGGVCRKKFWDMFYIVWPLVMLVDLGTFLSVPQQVRDTHKWARIPGGGIVLVVEYHLGYIK